MGNEKNLKPGAHTLTVEEQSRGGVNSGVSRRRNANLRKIAKGIIQGEEMESIVMALLETASDSDNKNQINAVKVIMQLLGQDKSPAEVKELNARVEKLKAETELIKAKAEIKDDDRYADDGFLEALEGTAEEDWNDEKAEETAV
jgi:uncharacterized small protein (DUF1192 family)